MNAIPRIVLGALLTTCAITEVHAMRWYSSSTGRWLSRDPLGDEAFQKQWLQDKSWSEREKIKQESLVPAYVFVSNDGLNHIDIYGLTAADVLKKSTTGRLPKMVGIDLTGAAVVGLGGSMAWSVQGAFFADTCEIAAFGVGPAIMETHETPNRPDWKKVFYDIPIGLDASLSINGSVAAYFGAGKAEAATWKGVFYGGQVGGGPIGRASLGLFWDPTGNWVGVSGGIGVSAFPVSARTNPQVYYMIGEPIVLPKCACYLLIYKMP